MSPFADPKVLKSVGIGGAIALMLTGWLTVTVTADLRELKKGHADMAVQLAEAKADRESSMKMMTSFVVTSQHLQEVSSQIGRQTCINTAITAKTDTARCTK